MADSSNDVESAQEKLVEAIYKLNQAIVGYEAASYLYKDDVARLDKDDIAKLHKIREDLTSRFQVFVNEADATNQ